MVIGGGVGGRCPPLTGTFEIWSDEISEQFEVLGRCVAVAAWSPRMLERRALAFESTSPSRSTFPLGHEFASR